jgi:hypothetical protein
MATFFWVGSTGSASSGLNPFNWAHLGNWKILQNGVPGSTAPGGTLARLTSATRFPLGGDVVRFGSVPQSTSSADVGYYHIYSPCLFGGISTGSDSRWTGSTAGTSKSLAYGSMNVTVNPTYPFSKLGGHVDLEVLNGWVNYLNAFHRPYGIYYPGFTLQSGTEYEDASYVAGPAAGTTAWGGTTYGISFASQTTYSVRTRGAFNGSAHKRTTISLAGFTGATSGATGAAFDGSGNYLNMNNRLLWLFPQFLNDGGTFPWSSGLPYETSDFVVSGTWNRIATAEGPSTHNSFVSLTNVKCNNLSFRPTSQFIYGPTGMPVSGSLVNSAGSKVDFGGVFTDTETSLKYLAIGNWKRLGVGGEIINHADISTTGGFACALSGLSSASQSAGYMYLSSFAEPPADSQSVEVVNTPVGIGFPGYDGSTKATTTIDYLQVDPFGNTPFTISIDGPIAVQNGFVQTGIIKKGANLPERANVDIVNLNLLGDTVIDYNDNPGQYGTNEQNYTVNSPNVTFKPGEGSIFRTSHVGNG